MKLGKAGQLGSRQCSAMDRRFEKRRFRKARRRAFKVYGPSAPTERRAFIGGWAW